MSHNLDLSDIGTLYDLQRALSRFSEEALASVQSAECEISQVSNWLQERLNHWQLEVRKSREALMQAEDDLRRCKASGYRDGDGHYHEPICFEEEKRVSFFSKQLHENQEKLDTTKKWKSKVEQAVNDFMREASRVKDLAGRHTEKALASLTKTAEKYEQVHSSTLHQAVALASMVSFGTANKLLDIFIARINKFEGNLGENIAKDMFQKLGYEVIPFDKTTHGFDWLLRGSDGQIVVIECKKSDKGVLHLGEGYGHRQGSVGWLEGVAQRMTDPTHKEFYSTLNAEIGLQIISSGIENTPVLATVYQPDNNIVEFFIRLDSTAETWAKIDNII